MPKVCSTTLHAVLPTMSPTSASASSIWSRASWETTSAYWSTHPSMVVRASLRNSGKSSANCRPLVDGRRDDGDEDACEHRQRDEVDDTDGHAAGQPGPVVPPGHPPLEPPSHREQNVGDDDADAQRQQHRPQHGHHRQKDEQHNGKGRQVRSLPSQVEWHVGLSHPRRR